MATHGLAARGGAGGPGRWAYIDLAGLLLDVGPESVPKEWLWQRKREDGSTAGGMVAADRRHATVLLRLDELSVNILREVVEQTEPFSLIPSMITLGKVDRLSKEFSEDVYSIGVKLDSPELVAFKARFINTLATRLCDGTAGARPETETDSPTSVVDLGALHNPYNDPSGGHMSLAYIHGDVLPEARAMQAAANERLAQGHPEVKVHTLCLRVSGEEKEVLRLGNFIPLENRAISFASLERFVSMHSSDLDDKMTTSEVVRRFIVPETKRRASSYAAAHSSSSHIDGCVPSSLPHVDGPVTEEQRGLSIGTVDFFCSHAWEYPFLDLVASIQEHSARQDKKLGRAPYYWLDIFAVNQHNIHSAAELPKLKDVIARATAVVIVLAPWDRPLALTRIWCLFEILSAMSSSTSVEVQMSPSQQASFTLALARDFNAIRTRLSEIDSANAKATQPADLKQIRNQIESTVGYNALNVLVKDQIRAWLLKNVLQHVEGDLTRLQTLTPKAGTGLPSDSDAIDHCNWVHTKALFLGEFGELDLARTLYEAVLLLRLRVLGRDHASTISVSNDLAFLLGKIGQAEAAERLLREQVSILEIKIAQLRASSHVVDRTLSPTTDAASSAVVYSRVQLGNFDGNVSEEDLATFRLVSLLCLTQNNLAMVVGTQHGRHEEALALYRAVLAKRNELYAGDNNGDSIATMNNMAWLMGKMGRNDEAVPLFTRVLNFRREHLGPTAPGTLNALQNLGTTLMKKGELFKAVPLLEESAKGKLENVGLGNPSTLRTITILIECLCQCNQRKVAQFWAAKVLAQDSISIPQSVVDRIQSFDLIKIK